MNQGIRPKPLMLVLLPVVVLACVRLFSTSAIPLVQHERNNIEIAGLALVKAKSDSQRADYFCAKVAPVLAKCQPCHFKGGKMYAQLPFDNPRTIRSLGTKLFTRIQDKKEQAVIRIFLEQTEDSTKTTR